MKNIRLMLAVVVVANMMMLSSCTTDTTPSTEADVCQIVFEAIRDNDVAMVSSLCLTEESLAVIADGMSENTPKEKEIKEEIQSFDVDEITDEVDIFFQFIRTQAEEDGVDLANGTYEGVVMTEDQAAVKGLTVRKAEFIIAFDAVNYVVRTYMLSAPSGMHLFDLDVAPYDKVDVSFVSPTDDPVVLTQGMDLDYEITFDAETANAQGAWIQIMFDGKNAGMVAGTTIDSPYSNDIPNLALKPGKHVLECRIHPVGSSTSHPLGVASLNIEVN